MKPNDIERAVVELRQLMTGTSREAAGTAQKFLTALLALTVKANAYNREQLKSALKAIAIVPKVGMADASIMNKLKSELKASAQSMEKTIEADIETNAKLIEKSKLTTPSVQESRMRRPR